MSSTDSAVSTARAEFNQLIASVIESVSSPHSRRAYAKAIEDFLNWRSSASPGPISKAVVIQYRSHLEAQGLAPSTINLRLAPLRKLLLEAADMGLMDHHLAAGIAKVRGVRRLGVRTGNWLDRDQAQKLLLAPDLRTLKGKRDHALLALLLGCGLRRAELVRLSVDDLQQREGRWILADMMGKGNRVRTVPVPSWVKAAIDAWTEAATIRERRLFRRVNKAGHVWGDDLSEKGIWSVVQQYAVRVGLPKLAPHDLRRTCAKLCRASGGDLEQIQFLLGHASIQTTERYLGSRQNLTHAVNDDLGLV